MSIPFGLRGKLLFPVLLVCFLMLMSIEFFWEPFILSHRQNLIIEKEKATLGSIAPGIIQLMLSSDIASLHRTLDTILHINDNTWRSVILYNANKQRLYPLDLKKEQITEHVIKIKHKLVLGEQTIGSIVLVVVLTPELLKASEDLHKQLAIELSFLFLFIALIIYWQNYLICKPLIRLKEGALQLTQGNFNSQLPNPSSVKITKKYLFLPIFPILVKLLSMFSIG